MPRSVERGIFVGPVLGLPKLPAFYVSLTLGRLKISEGKGVGSMIADAVARIQAIEQQLKEKTSLQLRARLTIRGCLKELRDISAHQVTGAGPNAVRLTP